MNYKLKAAPTAISKQHNSQKQAKANRIVLGVDVHLKSYEAARKIDNDSVGVVQRMRSKEEFLLYAQKQLSGPRKWWWSMKPGRWVSRCIGI
jgi:hypothetical protein